jgi:hypothetical protein
VDEPSRVGSFHRPFNKASTSALAPPFDCYLGRNGIIVGGTRIHWHGLSTRSKPPSPYPFPPKTGERGQDTRPIIRTGIRVKSSGQFLQLRGGVREIRRCEAFRVCGVDGGQRGVGFGAAALSLPNARHAHRGS